jgi:phosphate transport system protein
MDAQIITPHISRRYNKELENIFNKVLAMGGHVEEQMVRAFESLRKTDATLAREVVSLDRFINGQQTAIDELCLRLLARQQPTAIDLRLVMAALHIVIDLERIGDEITKLSRVVINITESSKIDCNAVPGYEHLVEMTVCAQEMLKLTLDAFANLDIKKALSLLPKEAAADEEYRNAQKLMREHMMANPAQIPEMLDLLNALRAMERVTDHSLNIAEHVFYVVEGSDLRQISSERLAEITEKYRESA